MLKFNSTDVDDKGGNVPVVPAQTQTQENVVKDYTMTDVALHKDASDCWTAINGFVYDVTSWISRHPGGKKAIVGLCGIDGSSAFNGKHGEQKRPAEELATFKIGNLK